MFGEIDKMDGATSLAEPLPTLGTVLNALGGSLLSALSAPRGLDVPVSMPVIYDREEKLQGQAGGILLLVGIAATDPAASEAVSVAARGGFAAIVTKPRGAGFGTLVETAQASGIALLACADEVSWRRLDALVSAAVGIDYAANPLQAGDMFTLANAIAGVLSGAVAIEDAARNVVAYSTVPGQRIDEVRSQGILARRIPDLAKHDLQYREVFSASSVVHYPFDPSTEELPRAAIAIRAGAEVLGSIWVIEEHPPLIADAIQVLEDAAKMAALYFLRTRTAIDLERQARGEVLRGLLEGRATLSIAESLGLGSPDPCALVGFSLARIDERGRVPFVPHLGTEVDRHISALRPEVPSVTIGATAYALIPSSADEGSALRLARETARHAGSVLGHPVRAAVQIASDPLRLPDTRDQVDETLRVLAEDPTAPDVARAADVSARILLARLRDAIDRHPTRVRHPSVNAILELDRRRGTAYRATLLAYFEAMGDVGSAAKRIQVHANTLRYRLRRAETLFGFDFGDPDERLLLWLQLRMMVDHLDEASVPDRSPAAN